MGVFKSSFWIYSNLFGGIFPFFKREYSLFVNRQEVKKIAGMMDSKTGGEKVPFSDSTTEE